MFFSCCVKAVWFAVSTFGQVRQTVYIVSASSMSLFDNVKLSTNDGNPNRNPKPVVVPAHAIL